jgi:hypothetical protein
MSFVCSSKILVMMEVLLAPSRFANRSILLTVVLLSKQEMYRFSGEG